MFNKHLTPASGSRGIVNWFSRIPSRITLPFGSLWIFLRALSRIAFRVSTPGVIALSLFAQVPASPAPTPVISGTVKSGDQPIPGATISATDSAGHKTITATDMDGSYAPHVPAAGHYTLGVEMTAFAPITHEVDVSGANTQANLELVLLSRAQPSGRSEQKRAGWGGGSRGFQNLALMQSEMGDSAGGSAADQVVPAGMPVPGIDPNAASESIAVAGNNSSMAGFAMSGDEMQQRMREAREQQGGLGEGGPGGQGGGAPGSGPVAVGGLPGAGAFGSFGGGPRGGDGFFGGRRGRFDLNHPHGMVYYTANDSALNAAPYPLTGQPSAKPGFLQQRFGVTLGGPLNIPKTYKGGSKTFFFFNYNGARGKTLYDAFSVVPTAAERSGDFSNSTILMRDASGNAGRTPVQLFYPSPSPLSGQPIPGNHLQNSGLTLSRIAQGLLNFIPMPNVPGASPDTQNFHFVTPTLNDRDDLNIRVNRALGGTSAGPRHRGPRNNLSFGFHYRATSANITDPLPSVGGTTATRGFDVPIGYVRSFGKLTNMARFDFNRSRTRVQNLYAFQQDITGELGISGVAQNPFDWGLPNLSFTNFGSLTDTNPQFLRNQTWTFSDDMIWNHGKHTLRWGGDFRRIQINTETAGSPRGGFTFTGFNTSTTQISAGVRQQIGGFDFADFLLGMPQQSSVSFGAPQFGGGSYHFRGNSWDLYAQDEWRLRGNLTLNLGLRYEYLSPLSETNNLIVNLDLPPGFTAPPVALQVGQTSPYSGALPATLVRPDGNNVQRKFYCVADLAHAYR